MSRCGEILRSSSAWQCRSVSPLLLTLALLLLLLLHRPSNAWQCRCARKRFISSCSAKSSSEKRPSCSVPTPRESPSRAARGGSPCGPAGEVWGHMGRCGEVWGGVGRCGERWGEMGGDGGRWPALCSSTAKASVWESAALMTSTATCSYLIHSQLRRHCVFIAQCRPPHHLRVPLRLLLEPFLRGHLGDGSAGPV